MRPARVGARPDAGLAARIGAFVQDLRWESLPPARQRRVRWLLADYIGCTLAGSTLPEAASGFVLAQPGTVTLPGDAHRLATRLPRIAPRSSPSELPVGLASESMPPGGLTAESAPQVGLAPESAALAMGTVGALLQIHDGFGGGGNHPGSAVISALWAAREERPLAHLLVAVAAGYEVANRIACCSHPAQTLAGSAPTSTSGAIGAAAAVGRLRGLAPRALADALSIAAFLAPVAALRGLTEHGSVVPLHGGFAARTALEAVRLAEAGLAAGERILEGGRDPGLLAFLHGDASALAPETWRGETIDGVYFKPLPACRHAQPAVEAVLAILADGPVDAEAIREVRVHTYPVALAFGDAPRPEHELYDRLMSMPWAIASCLVRGGYGIDNVVGAARDPRVEALYPRIVCRVDPAYEAHYPRRLCTRVEVESLDARVRTGECRMEYGVHEEGGPYSPRGTTTRPLDEEGMRSKFLDLACRRIDRAQAQSILDGIFEEEP